jgi:hypothetical protein
MRRAGSRIETCCRHNPDPAVAQSVATDYQLMLVIDVSGSMDSWPRPTEP